MAIFCCHCHFYPNDKKPACNCLGLQQELVGWLCLAGVNAHTSGQCGSAMTYDSDCTEGKLQSQLFPLRAVCLLNREGGHEGLWWKENTDILKNKHKETQRYYFFNANIIL